MTRLTLNDGRRRNALSEAMLEALMDAVTKENDRDDCRSALSSPSLLVGTIIADKLYRAIVLAANGPVFSSGHNLRELTSASGPETHKPLFRRCSQLMEMLGEVQVG